MKTSDEHYRELINSMDEDVLLEFVSARVKEAIEDTRRTRIRVDRTLKELARARVAQTPV